MAAPTAWAVHNNVKEYIGNGVINFDTNTFGINLYLSTSDLTVASNAMAPITNQHATANGYTQNAKMLTSPTWALAGGTATFDANAAGDVFWTAAGGSIQARFALIYDDTVAAPVAKPSICSCTLDSAPADVTATTGNTFTIAFNASGIFTLT